MPSVPTALKRSALALVTLVLMVGSGTARSAPVAGWEALALGTATTGPVGGGGASGALGLLLLNRWNNEEMGHDLAQIPIDPVRIVADLTVVVPDKGGAGIAHGLLRFDILATWTEGGPRNRQIVEIGTSVGMPLDLQVDDAYSALVDAHAESNGDTRDAHASDGPHVGSSAHADASADASAPGTPVENPVFKQRWGVFTQSFMSIDGGALSMFNNTEWSKDEDGHLTALNLITDMPAGTPMPGSFQATGTASTSFTLGPGTHALHFEHDLWGFLETNITGVPEPSMPSILGLQLLALTVARWSCKRRQRQPKRDGLSLVARPGAALEQSRTQGLGVRCPPEQA